MEPEIINEKELAKLEQIERGERIKYIREHELKMTKTQLAKKLGISSQFLGLVEDGRGNLMYHSVKRLKEVSGHSSDYILYGLDDDVIARTNRCLQKYSESEIKTAIEIVKNISMFIRRD